MIERLFEILILGTGLMLSSGCATMESRTEAPPELWTDAPPKLYPATRMDLSAFRQPFEDYDFPKWVACALLPVAILDLPFSLVSDTLLFPHDAWRVFHCDTRNKQ